MFNSPARFPPVRDSTRSVAKNPWNTPRPVPGVFAPLLSLLLSLAFLLASAACVPQANVTGSISEFDGRIELTSARKRPKTLPADCDLFRCFSLTPSSTFWVASTDTLTIDWSRLVASGVSDHDPPKQVSCNFCNLVMECTSGENRAESADLARPGVRLIDTITKNQIGSSFDYETGCQADVSPPTRSTINDVIPPPGSSSLQLQAFFGSIPEKHSSLFNFETVSPGMPRVWHAVHSLDDLGLKNLGDSGSTMSVHYFGWNMCGDVSLSHCPPWPANFSTKLEIVSVRVLQGQPFAGDPDRLDPRTASPIHVYSMDSVAARARCFPNFNQLNADRLPPFEINFSNCRNSFPVPQADGTCTTANDLSNWRLTPGYQTPQGADVDKSAIVWEVHFAEDGRCGIPLPDLSKGRLWLEFTIRVIP